MIIQKIHYKHGNGSITDRLCHQDWKRGNTDKDANKVTCKKCLKILRAERDAELQGERLS